MTTLANPTSTGWRVYAHAGKLDVWFSKDGGKPIRARVAKGRLSILDVQALKALQVPILARKVPRRSRVTAPTRWRGKDNTGAKRRAFILRLAGRSPVEIILVDQSLVGTGLMRALQHRINRRQVGELPLPPAFLQKETDDGLQHAQGQHRAEEVLADSEEPGPRPVEGLDQPGELLPAGPLHQEPQVGA